MSFLSGSKNNHQKDLLSILDQVKHSEDDGKDEFNFDSNKLNLNFDEDPENQSVPTIEESKPKVLHDSIFFFKQIALSFL